MCAHLHHTGKAAPALCVYVSVLVPVTNGPPLYGLFKWPDILVFAFLDCNEDVQGWGRTYAGYTANRTA